MPYAEPYWFETFRTAASVAIALGIAVLVGWRLTNFALALTGHREAADKSWRLFERYTAYLR